MPIANSGARLYRRGLSTERVPKQDGFALAPGCLGYDLALARSLILSEMLNMWWSEPRFYHPATCPAPLRFLLWLIFSFFWLSFSPLPSMPSSLSPSSPSFSLLLFFPLPFPPPFSSLLLPYLPFFFLPTLPISYLHLRKMYCLRTETLRPDFLICNLILASYWPCDLRPVTQSLCAWIS